MSMHVRKIDIKPDSKLYDVDSEIMMNKLNQMMKTETTSLINYENSESSGVEDLVFNYISDIHLDYKIKKDIGLSANGEDIEAYLCKIVSGMKLVNSERYHHFTLFAGDTSYNPKISALFYDIVNNYSTNPEESISVLGNHELWGKKPETTLEQYVGELKNKWSGTLLQNDVLFIRWCAGYWREPTTYLYLDVQSYDKIMSLSNRKLRSMCESAISIIIGGVGFTGYNTEWNASFGIYGEAISAEEDLKQTMIFESLYEKMKKVASDMAVIVLTHMPKDCWSKKPYVSGWTYVNGHTHMNTVLNSDGAFIFSDNQVGYDKNEIKLKRFPAKPGFDIFKSFKDGIHEISRKQFLIFHHNMAINCTFTREGKVYLLKREGLYMFIFKNKKNKLRLMRGGKLHALKNNDLCYYYDNMITYNYFIDKFMKPYTEYQKKVSAKIKMMGGDGRIHGCIVDIDYYCHVYVNPFDGSVTPYYAEDTVEKWAYPDILSLLKERKPELYTKIQESSSQKNGGALEILNLKPEQHGKSVYVSSEEIYDYSWMIYELQRVVYNKIIRTWDERIINNKGKFSSYDDSESSIIYELN